MSNIAEFYMITFVMKNNDNDYVSYGFRSFLEKLSDLYENHPELFYRDIGERKVRMTRPLLCNDITVIPFGKLKNGQVYSYNDAGFSKLEQELFDIACLAYDGYNKMSMIAKTKSGPSAKLIQHYLNSFIPSECELALRLIPVTITNGLARIENAKYVRDICLKLNLDSTIINFYKESQEDNSPVAKVFKQLAHISKNNLGSNNLEIHLSLGNKKRNESLDRESCLDLLANLNMDSEVVSEVTVKYKKDEDERIDVAKLKHSKVILNHKFSINDNHLGSEYLLNNCEDVFTNKRPLYRAFREEILSNSRNVDVYLEELNENWKPEEFYE